MIEDISNKRVLDFSSGEYSVFGKLTQSPRDYIAQVKRLNHPITLIKVDSNHPQHFFESLRDLVNMCDDNVCIKNCEIAETPNKKEFFIGEQIIDDIISEINPKWDKKQKIAYIHHKIGKILSYIPDFMYKMNDKSCATDARNIWNALVKGKSVCNGITFINMTILSRLGIESEQLQNTSGSHSFLLIKTDEGNIITDPTWDLWASLYDLKPNYFGKNYEQIREMDKGFTAHLVENPPEDVIEIDEAQLREIFYSIGLTNDDRTFPAPIIELVNSVNQTKDIDRKKKLEEFLKMYLKQFKEESTHICESIDILEACGHEIGIDKFKLSCVYSKEDNECENPILIFHSGEDELKEMIYMFPSDGSRELKSICIEEFDKKYKVHSQDSRVPFWKNYLKKDINIGEKVENVHVSQ